MQVIIGIDLAGKPENPTGLALLEGKTVQSSLINTDEEPLKSIICNKPALTAIDAPFNPPKEGIQRKAERKMPEKGYRILPPSLAARRERALRAMKLSMLMANKGYKAIEVHSTSPRRVRHSFERLEKDSNHPDRYRLERSRQNPHISVT